MKKIFYLLIAGFLLMTGTAVAQCPSGDLVFGDSGHDPRTFNLFYPDCKNPQGSVYLTKTARSTMGLLNLESIKGDLVVYETTLDNLQGLWNLKSIGGILDVNGNILMSSLQGLEKLSSVGGLLINGNRSLANISSLSALTKLTGDMYGIDYGDGISYYPLIIRENPVISFAGLANIDYSTIDYLHLTSNTGAQICSYDNICSYMKQSPQLAPRFINPNDCEKTGCFDSPPPSTILEIELFDMAYQALNGKYRAEIPSSPNGRVSADKYTFVKATPGFKAGFCTIDEVKIIWKDGKWWLEGECNEVFLDKMIFGEALSGDPDQPIPPCGPAFGGTLSSSNEGCYTVACAPPTPDLLTTSASVCAGDDASFLATCSGMEEVRWYTSGGTYISSGWTFTATKVNASTTYSVRCHNGTCEGTGVTVTVTVNTPPTLAVDEVSQPGCKGPGSIKFKTKELSGTHTLSYRLNGKEASKQIQVTGDAFVLSELEAGTYSGFSIAGNSCGDAKYANEIVLKKATGDLTLAVATLNHPTGCSSSDGSIVFNTTQIPDGSTADLSYDMNGAYRYIEVKVNNNRFSLTGLSAARYSNFRLSFGDCGAADMPEKILEAASAKHISIKQLTHPTTCQAADGSIHFSTDLPDGGYDLIRTHHYLGSQTSPVQVKNGEFTLSGLERGIYSDFVIVYNTCNTEYTGGEQRLECPTPFSFSIVSVKNASCLTHFYGVVTFKVAGLKPGGEHKFQIGTGTTPYDYTLVQPDADGIFTANIMPGTGIASFTLFDSFSDDRDYYTLTPDQPVMAGTDETFIEVESVVLPSAAGAADGSILFNSNLSYDCCLHVSFSGSGGGTGGLQTVEVIDGKFALTGLTAGVYSDFTFPSDACGFLGLTERVSLTGPVPVLQSGTVTHPASCGENNGSIEFSTNLDPAQYTLNYTLDNQEKTAKVTVSDGKFILNDLSQGVYSGFSIVLNNTVVKNNKGNITLEAPGAPQIKAGTVTHPSACSGADGSITFSTNLSDGNHTLKYKKGDSNVSATINVSKGTFTLGSLSAGIYSAFSVTNNKCVVTLSETRTLTAPAAPALTLIEKKDPSTCGVDDASITFGATLAPGSYPLSYQIDGAPKTTKINLAAGSFKLTGLAGGIYSDFVLSGGTCDHRLLQSITVANPVAPGGTITPEGPTELCENETVTLTAAAGASYLWSNGKTTRSITVSEAGTYKVKVTSAQGCESNAEIKVEKKICNLPPVAVCKPLVVIVANPNDCYSVVTTKDLDAGSYDPNGDWTRHTLLNTDGIFRPGTYTVTYEVMDPKGAFSTCQSEVRILDHTPPVARARDLHLELDANGQASITIADVDAGSYDNCGPVTLSLNRTTFDCSDLGNLQVRLTVTDASGNVSEALSDITISDNTPPVIQANNVTLTLDENGRAAVSTESLSSGISDNCGIWSISTDKTEFTCTDIGENDVTLRVEDVRGNVTEAKIKVTVLDDTAPELVISDVTLYLDANGKASLTPQQASAGSKDNCAITSLALDREQFSCQDAGEHQVTLTAKDAAGNISTATFKVTVRDTIAPKAIAKNLTVVLDESGFGRISAAQADNGSTDNCEIVSLTLSLEEFGCQQVGTHQVTLTATDAAGNTGSATFTVTVEDKTAPVVLTRNAVMELDWDGKATLNTGDIDEGSTDNCGIQSLQLSQTEFTCTDLGRRIVRLTATDASGNTTTETAVVTIKDPNGVCPCSYGVLAFDGIKLKDNEVSAGGVGVINSGKKVKLRNTVINKEGTFVKAPQNNFDRESESSVYIRGGAPQPEGFRKNGNKDKKKEKIGKGESRTLSAGNYGKVKAGKDATLTFSGGDVFIRNLKVGKGANLVFAGNTALLVRKAVKLGKNTAVNTAGEQMRIYAGGNVSIGNGSEVRGYLHSQGHLKTRRGGEITSLEGLFVADRIRGGKNTHWAGGGVMCTGNEEPEALLASRKERRKKAGSTKEGFDKPGFDKLSLTDSTRAGIQVNLWPNPVVTDKLNISIESEAAGGEFMVVDFLGNIISKNTYTGHQANHALDLSRATPGIYILRVSSGGKTVTRRVMKEK